MSEPTVTIPLTEEQIRLMLAADADGTAGVRLSDGARAALVNALGYDPLAQQQGG